MTIDEMLKKMEERYAEIKDLEFDSTTNYCTPQGYGYIRGFGHAIELIKSYQEMNKEEKENLYYVRAGNRYVRFNLDGSMIGVKRGNSAVCLERLSKLPFEYKKAIECGIITLEEVTE